MSKIEAGITSQNIEDADGDLELTDLLRNWARWANHGDDGGPQQATTCASAERHHPIPVWAEEESPPKPPDALAGQRVENRQEQRRVWKVCVGPRRSRWSLYTEQKNN